MNNVNCRSFLTGLAAVAAAPKAAAQARRFEMNQSARIVIEGGREHSFADTIFEVPPDYSGEEIGLEIGPDARIDVLRIRLAPGARDIDRFMRINSGVHIGLLDVEAAQQTNRHDERLDGFIQIRADDITVEEMRFLRIDRCVTVNRAARLRIGRFSCTSYSKGMRINRSEDVIVSQFHARLASPNAVAGKPGENGLTIFDSQRLEFSEVMIEDAAEHAIYIAGGSQDRFSEDIHFGHVITRRSNRCGFKCKAPRTPSRGISIDWLDVSDAAYRAPKGRANEDALRVENAHNFHVGRLEARCVESTTSCNVGIYLNGVKGFTLTSGYIDCPKGDLVLLRDSRGFDNEDITIIGLDGRRLGLNGYHLHYTKGRSLSGLSIQGGLLDGVAGDAVRISDGLNAVSGTNHIHIAARAVRGAAKYGSTDMDVKVILED